MEDNIYDRGGLMFKHRYFQAVIPPDDRYEKMIRIRDACKDAGVDIPYEVVEYIEKNKPQTAPKIVDLECVEGGNDHFSMFILNMDDVPDRTGSIRFVIEHQNQEPWK